MVSFSSCPCHIRLGSGACIQLWRPEPPFITTPTLPEDMTNKLTCHPARRHESWHCHMGPPQAWRSRNMRPFGSRGCHLLAEGPLIWVSAEWKFFCFHVRPRLLVNNAGRMWGRTGVRPRAQRAAAALTRAQRPRLFRWGPRPPPQLVQGHLRPGMLPEAPKQKGKGQIQASPWRENPELSGSSQRDSERRVRAQSTSRARNKSYMDPSESERPPSGQFLSSQLQPRGCVTPLGLPTSLCQVCWSQ